jgi:endonuclease YncB( thermonuclease family)
MVARVERRDGFVTAVQDGDTLHAFIRLGLKVWYDAEVRLDHINAPEIGTEKEPIVEGEHATLGLMSLLGPRSVFTEHRTKGSFGKLGPYETIGPKIEVELALKESDEFEKYGRVLATVYGIVGGEVSAVSLNDLMVQRGYAEPKRYSMLQTEE